jgi:multimeric flavodoxin WrbA
LNIVVLNGSPKGEVSITVQYVHYLQKKFPQHKLTLYHVAHQINQLEKDDHSFQDIIAHIQAADGVLWAFPLYYCLVCSQYKRFIELLWEKEATAAFKDKYTAVLTTSIHFYDHTAHNYLHSIADDLGMCYVDGFSAAMADLLEEDCRQKLLYFAQNFFYAIEKALIFPKAFPPLMPKRTTYLPSPIKSTISQVAHKVVIVTDGQTKGNLSKMITHLQQSFQQPVEIYNLQEIDIRGGCLGCIHCAYDNTCVYQDGFKDFITTKLVPANILVFAGAMKDRYLSSRWKIFFDRTFFNNHVPLFAHKQFAYLISGPLSQEANLRQIIDGYTQLQGANLVGIVSDEGPSQEIDATLESLADRLITCADQNYEKPLTFLAIGGKKLFRDEIWGNLRFPFVADFAYYRKNGLFDFPYKDSRWLARAFMSLLVKIPAFRKEVYDVRTKNEMIKPLVKLLERD